MEEKERYELKIYAGCESYSITDTKEKQQITLNNAINLLNKQNKRIKELEQSQNQLAIKILKELRDKFCNIGYNGDYDIDYFEVMKEIDKQIKQLKGEK